jgi:hypothetical protein
MTTRQLMDRINAGRLNIGTTTAFEVQPASSLLRSAADALGGEPIHWQLNWPCSGGARLCAYGFGANADAPRSCARAVDWGLISEASPSSFRTGKIISAQGVTMLREKFSLLNAASECRGSTVAAQQRAADEAAARNFSAFSNAVGAANSAFAAPTNQTIRLQTNVATLAT